MQIYLDYIILFKYFISFGDPEGDMRGRRETREGYKRDWSD